MKTKTLNDFVLILRRLRSETRGNVAIHFSLAMIPILMMVGAAIDYNRALSAQATLQSAADSAAIVVAQASSSTQAQRLSLAQSAVAANLGSLASAFTVTVGETDPSSSKNFYEVTARGALPTTIMNIAQISSMPISVKSGAKSTVSGPGNGCVLSLDNSAVDDIWDNGSASVTLTNCDIYDNSSNGSALDVSGNASLTARQVNVVGGVHGSSKITAQVINTGVARTADPYSWLPLPAYTSSASCNGYSTTSTVTLSPGVYCGGFHLTSHAVVTLSPGLYIFDQGSFQIDGQATLQSSGGVTLVFTSSTGNNWPTLTINGGATVTLSAPTTANITAGNNGLNGILFYGDRNMSVGTSFQLNGGSNQTMTGAIYLPEAAVTYNGNTGANGNCLQLIGDTIHFIGNSTVAINGCNSYNLSTFGQPITPIPDVTLVE